MVSVDSLYSARPVRGARLFPDARVDEVFTEGIGPHLKRELSCPKGRRLTRRLVRSVSKGTSAGFIYGRQHCESPVEEILLAAAAWSVGVAGWQIPLICPATMPVPTYYDVVIVPQHPIGCYRVDFAIYARQMRLVVEVDGHEWHEKTKEQASKDKRRDRDLQQEGWAVFHFTGSDVWRDPFGCCDVINRYIQRELPS